MNSAPDIARINGVWRQNQVPREELVKLESYTAESLEVIADTLEAQNPDHDQIAEANRRASELKRLFRDVAIDMPQNTAGSKQYTWTEEIGGPGPYHFRWEFRDHYTQTTYHWQEADRVNEDLRVLRNSAAALEPLVAESLEKPGPISQEETQVDVHTENVKTGTRELKHSILWGLIKWTTTEDVWEVKETPILKPSKPMVDDAISALKKHSHDLSVVGEKIDQDGLHEERRVREHYDSRPGRW